MRAMRIIEVTTQSGHKAAKCTSAREIDLTGDGGLRIDGRTYSAQALARHLESILERVASVLAETASAVSDDARLETLRWRAAANRREVLRRINALQTEILDNGFTAADTAAVLVPLRRRTEEWFARFGRPGAAL
jgi:hypothetical protein